MHSLEGIHRCGTIQNRLFQSNVFEDACSGAPADAVGRGIVTRRRAGSFSGIPYIRRLTTSRPRPGAGVSAPSGGSKRPQHLVQVVHAMAALSSQTIRLPVIIR